MIGASSRLTASGTASGRVMMAWRSAEAHSQVRSSGRRPTAAGDHLLGGRGRSAVRLAMIISTVT